MQSSAVQARQLVPGTSSANDSALQTNKLFLPFKLQLGLLGFDHLGLSPSSRVESPFRAESRVVLGLSPASGLSPGDWSLGQFSTTSTGGGSAAGRVSRWTGLDCGGGLLDLALTRLALDLACREAHTLR